MERTEATGGTSLRPVTVVYLLMAAVLSVVAVVRGFVLASTLSVPSSDLISGDAYSAVWWSWVRLQLVALVALPANAAAATHTMPPAVGATGVVGRRVATIAPWICVAGALLFESTLQGSGASAGWFNYAPNSGVTFSSGGAVGRQLLGISLVWLGLWITAVSLLVTVGARRDRRERLLRAGPAPLLLTATQLVIAVCVPFVVGRMWWDLWVEPGLWGR